MKRALRFSAALFAAFHIASSAAAGGLGLLLRSDSSVTGLSAVELLLDSSSSGLAVLSLPAPGEGLLLCNGRPLPQYGEISREQLESLVLVSRGGAVCRLELLPLGAETADSISIAVAATDYSGTPFDGIEIGQYSWKLARRRYFECIFK